MIHATQIKFNSQRNNKALGKISPGVQCGYTSLSMLLSAVYPEAGTDGFVSNLVDDIEPLVGKPGFGEKLFSKANWKGGWIYSQVFAGKARAGAYFQIYAEYAKQFVADKEINCEVEFCEKGGDWERVKEHLKKGVPVMIGTRILPSGHFIVLVDYDPVKKEFIALDPWGDANTKYKIQDGNHVIYGEEYLKKNAPDITGKLGTCRYLVLIQKNI